MRFGPIDLGFYIAPNKMNLNSIIAVATQYVLYDISISAEMSDSDVGLQLFCSEAELHFIATRFYSTVVLDIFGLKINFTTLTKLAYAEDVINKYLNSNIV